MTRLAIVNSRSGLVLGSTDSSVLAEGEDELLASLAVHVAEIDPAESRVFDLYRLPAWDEMTEVEQFTLPRSIDALKANDAVIVRSVEVPMNRHYMNRYGV